jgi:hypothetical protein
MENLQHPHKPGNSFSDAAKDYLLLLEKRYPRKTILNLIGDRYSLSGIERSMLYRGITTQEEATHHSSKLTAAGAIKGSELHIDGYNTLITIGSYLNGNLVFISNDNFLRDASEIHGKAFRSGLFDKATLLLFSFLKPLNPSLLQFYFDEPMSHSGELCAKINAMLAHCHMEGTAATYKSPDYQLKTVETGLVATSDSGIIERCKLPVVDLPALVINHHFHKPILNIRIYMDA